MMPYRNRTKLGSTIPVLPSPSWRNVARSPRPQPPPPPPAPTRSTSQASELDKELPQGNRSLMKQLSMNESSAARDIAWEKRRRQIIRKERRRNSISIVTTPEVDPAAPGEVDKLTDADLHDLKGSIELGFGFNEEEGQKLCSTLPALDLYFAVNRKLSPSPVSTPRQAPSSRMSSMSTPNSPSSDQDSWKIFGPGDDPQQVKTKLRHWAQAVACSIIQSSS